jgi:hypothetical protein
MNVPFHSRGGIVGPHVIKIPENVCTLQPPQGISSPVYSCELCTVCTHRGPQGIHVYEPFWRKRDRMRRGVADIYRLVAWSPILTLMTLVRS